MTLNSTKEYKTVYAKTKENQRDVNDWIKTLCYHHRRFWNQLESARRSNSNTPDLDLFGQPLFYHITASYRTPSSLVRERNGTQRDRFSLLDTRETIKFINKESSLLHNHICNKIVKNHNRKQNRKYRPIALTFVDFPGTRQARAKIHTLAHTHAVYLICPTTQSLMEDLVQNNFRLDQKVTEGSTYTKRNTLMVSGVHAKVITNSKQDLTNVIDYASKYYYSSEALSLDEDHKQMLWNLYD